MSENIVKLVFHSSSTGGGFEKVEKSTASVIKSMKGLNAGLSFIGSSLGGVGSRFGQVAAMLVSGGVWGAAISGASLAVSGLIGWFDKLMMKNDEVTRRFREQQKYLRSYAAAVEGYHRRVESWKKAKADADKDEKEAAEKAKEAADKLNESRNAAVKFAQSYYAIVDKIAMEEEKSGLNSDKEIVRLRTKVKLMLDAAKADVSDKRRGVDSAMAGGSGYDVDIAKKSLELALAQQKNIVAEAKKLVAEYRKAKDLKEEETEQTMEKMRREDAERESRDEKRAALEKAREETRKRYADAIKKVEDEIARKKDESARLEANAARARGVSFGSWSRDERDREREERRATRQQAKREASVDAEIARLEKTNPRTMTAWQRNRLSKLREWKSDQDPANNPADNELKALNEKRDKLIEAQNVKLDKIANLLEEAVRL